MTKQKAGASSKIMPKGVRKGGARFPRINLEQATKYAKRLVSKTHSGPQSAEIVYSGVLDAKGPTGEIRISALKQYGFVLGDTKAGFEASNAAKLLTSAPPAEQSVHYRAAALQPKIFKALFDTFHGDKVSRAKLKQRAASLDVHPDLTDACVDNYLASATFANLVTVEGEDCTHVSEAELSVGNRSGEKGADSQTDLDPGRVVDPPKPEEQTPADNATSGEPKPADSARPLTAQAIFNVNISLDSSMDSDKLEKQLKLLKQYGVT